MKTHDVFLTALSEVEFEAARSSGAGGQNVNKVNSKAILRWNLNLTRLPDSICARLRAKLSHRISRAGELGISCDQSRDFPANKKECLRRLESLIHEALKIEKVRVPTKATKGSQRKRLEKKKRHQVKKQSRSRVDWD